jgi:hypothetical protein
MMALLTTVAYSINKLIPFEEAEEEVEEEAEEEAEEEVEEEAEEVGAAGPWATRPKMSRRNRL